MTQRAIEAGARALARSTNPHNARGRNLDAYEAIHWADYKDRAAAVITAYEAHIKAEGLVVAPSTPTPAMTAAAWLVISDLKLRMGVAKLGPGLGVGEVYTAMLAAAVEVEEPWTPPFKVGDRVKHISRNETGTVTSIDNGEVVVEFDGRTPAGNVSIGRFDKRWLESHHGWLVAAASQESNDAVG